jgi:cation transporter-like permease
MAGSGGGVLDGREIRRMVRGTTNLVVSTFVNLALLAVIAVSEWGLTRLTERLWPGGSAPVMVEVTLWAGAASSAVVVIVSMALDAAKTLRNIWSEGS